MGKHAQPQQPEENGTSQYPASGEEGGVGKQGMGRGKLIAIIAAIVVVALVLLQVVLYLARDDEDDAGSAPARVPLRNLGRSPMLLWMIRASRSTSMRPRLVNSRALKACPWASMASTRP